MIKFIFPYNHLSVIAERFNSTFLLILSGLILSGMSLRAAALKAGGLKVELNLDTTDFEIEDTFKVNFYSRTGKCYTLKEVIEPQKSRHFLLSCPKDSSIIPYIPKEYIVE